MRKNTITISERNLMFAIGGQLFDQAPNRQPRKPGTIMKKVRDSFRKDAYNDNEYYTLRIPKDESYKYIKDLLMGIPDFVELNLTQIEYDKNISVDDPGRPSYAFTSRYDKETAESWKHNFIDLDAFIRNAYGRLLTLANIEHDCFCCTNEGDLKKEICKGCIVNPNLKYNFEGERYPKEGHKFACRYDCYRSYYICCEECSKSNSCLHRCDGESKSCGNKINERTV